MKRHPVSPEGRTDPMESTPACFSCSSRDLSVFYELSGVPVHSVLLVPDRETALNFPRGTISLAFCRTCGFVSNIAFDPGMMRYSSNYEETQGFSETFDGFSRGMAATLIERYDLRGKDIIEIGCGKGEFLSLLCDLGGNRGIGFDPAYVRERMTSGATDRITFIEDYYSEKYSEYQGDFIICKMTLEHIQKTYDFVHMIRRSVGSRPDTVVIFQVPDVVRILKEMAFWDIYYEHCSYFSLGSLARLFRAAGFDVLDLWKEYDGQYLVMEARPRESKPVPLLPQENDMTELQRDVDVFSEMHANKIRRWRELFRDLERNGRRAVIWGAGSKGVAFLTTLNVKAEMEYAVDINPFKHGTYLAGCGQEIVAPGFLKDYKPDVVIVMNPIYCDEIKLSLWEMGLTPDLLTVLS